MAKETITIIRDDIDGSDGAKSYSFALGPNRYEIDLTDANYRKLEDALKPYIKAGSKASSGLSRSNTVKGNRNSREEVQRIREWAKENDYSVSERGRIPLSVVEAYNRTQ